MHEFDYLFGMHNGYHYHPTTSVITSIIRTTTLTTSMNGHLTLIIN